MSRVFTIAVIVLGISCSLVSATLATPIVSFRARFIPIPGVPHTGNKPGVGTALEVEYRISGTEYGGDPAPLTHLSLSLPPGAEIQRTALPTCTGPGIGELGPGSGWARCNSSQAHLSLPSTLEADVAFGTKVLAEKTSIEVFNLPGGPLLRAHGYQPTVLELEATVHYTTARGAHGEKLELELPLVETVPGAQYASIRAIKLRLGASQASHGRTHYFLTTPKRCQRRTRTHARYQAFKSELIFAAVGGLQQTSATKRYLAAC